MSFLRKTSGMTPHEAREVCQLHELIQHSSREGPIPLKSFAEAWRLKTSDVHSMERTARRLVARLVALGYRVVAEGDVKPNGQTTLTLDFSVDEALTAIVERSIDVAHELRTQDDGFDEDEAEGEPDDSRRIAVEALKKDHKLGLTIRDLCRRYGITKDRTQSILRAYRLSRPEGRPPVERCRSMLAIEEALEFGRAPAASRKNGRVAAVARILGCHRDTARAFLKRYDAIRSRAENCDRGGPS